MGPRDQLVALPHKSGQFRFSRDNRCEALLSLTPLVTRPCPFFSVSFGFLIKTQDFLVHPWTLKFVSWFYSFLLAPRRYLSHSDKLGNRTANSSQHHSYVWNRGSILSRSQIVVCGDQHCRSSKGHHNAARFYMNKILMLSTVHVLFDKATYRSPKRYRRRWAWPQGSPLKPNLHNWTALLWITFCLYNARIM